MIIAAHTKTPAIPWAEADVSHAELVWIETEELFITGVVAFASNSVEIEVSFRREVTVVSKPPGVDPFTDVDMFSSLTAHNEIKKTNKKIYQKL